MKFIIAFAVLIAVAAARPSDQDAAAQVLKHNSDAHPDGSYTFSVETSNGIVQNESGEVRQVPGAEEPAVVVHGEYSYPSPDGTHVHVSYTADENGFKPELKHLSHA